MAEEITFSSDDPHYDDTEARHGPPCGTKCFKDLEHHEEVSS